MAGFAVLISGSGSIMEAMAEQGIPIDLVVADRKCEGLEKAKARGIGCALLERTDFSKTFNYAVYTQTVIDILEEHGITKVAMAGWMTIFDAKMFDDDAFGGRLLNTHPALLPAFKGAHVVRDTLTAGVKVTGCTIHVATLALDAGPIVDQQAVRVMDGDSEKTLHERIKMAERKLYADVVRRWINQELHVTGLVQ